MTVLLHRVLKARLHKKIMHLPSLIASDVFVMKCLLSIGQITHFQSESGRPRTVVFTPRLRCVHQMPKSLSYIVLPRMNLYYRSANEGSVLCVHRIEPACTIHVVRSDMKGCAKEQRNNNNKPCAPFTGDSRAEHVQAAQRLQTILSQHSRTAMTCQSCFASHPLTSYLCLPRPLVQTRRRSPNCLLRSTHKR